MLLFLVAAGLTLVFGVMDFINLAHGVQYMLGAYLAVMFYGLTGNFFAARARWRCRRRCCSGWCWRSLVFRHLYERDHLEQVLATFGVILFLNQGVKMLWGAAPLNVPMPDLLSGSVLLMDGLRYPVYRFAIIARRPRGRGPALSAGRPHARRHAGARRAPPTRRWCRRSASTSGGCS